MKFLKMRSFIRALAGLLLILMNPMSLASEAAPKNSRKIPSTYKRYEDPTNKKTDATAATTTSATSGLPSIPGYTPAAETMTTAGSPAVSKKEKKPIDLASILSALAGGGGGGGTPGDGGAGPGGDPAILNAPANQEYNASGSSTDSGFTPSGPAPAPNVTGSSEDYGPEVHGTDYSKASCGLTQSTWVTHYGSDPSKYSGPKEAKLEGGPKDRHGRLLNSVEESIQNGQPVSLAGDIYNEFGQRCNQSPKSACLMLLCYNNFDQVYPEYRARFPGVQKNCLIGVITDTGGAFFGTNGKKIDVATRSIEKARKISGAGRYYEIETDSCKKASGRDKRNCVVNNVQAACVADGAAGNSGQRPGQGAGRQ